MHNFFREKLKDAYGESKFVVVLNVDVRGFSKFSKMVDSAESALFVKKVFIKFLQNYFSSASYYKSTGDGLIIIYDISEDSLKSTTNQIIDLSVRLIDEFKNLCLDEAMINFEVPKMLGIGVSRGPATCLRTSDAILDYFGDTLNTASRLMDCARPEGVVFDSKFGYDLLEDRLKELFDTKPIYLKGVSESAPLDVWFLKDRTQLSPSLSEPIVETKWVTVEEVKKFKQIKELGGKFFIILDQKPIDSNLITLVVTHDALRSNGTIHRGYVTRFEFKGVSYRERAGEKRITIDFDELIVKLNENKVLSNMDVTMELKFPVA